jgi:hypothetical protein
MAGAACRLGHGRLDGSEFNHPNPLIAVSFTAALFRRAVFDQIGGLDEDFISYLEDMDFSIRLWRAGLRGLYLPTATARHHGGASYGGAESAATFRLLTRNQALLVMKHYPFRSLIRLFPRLFAAKFLWFGMALRKGLLGAWVSGIFAGLRAYPKLARKRTAMRSDGSQNFLVWLRESECAIYDDISARPRNDQDTYWRLYFALFHPRGKHAVRNFEKRPPEPAFKEEGEAGPSLRRRFAESERRPR